jgi:hypothetical protein
VKGKRSKQMGTKITFLVIVAALLLLSSGLVANAQKSPNRFAETRSPIVPQFKSLLLEPGPGFGKSGLDDLPLLNENTGNILASE